jgi:hypothetical protein
MSLRQDKNETEDGYRPIYSIHFFKAVGSEPVDPLKLPEQWNRRVFLAESNAMGFYQRMNEQPSRLPVLQYS